MLSFQNLIHETMMDVDSPRAGAGEIADEFLKRRRRLKRIVPKDVEQRLGLRFESGAAEFLCVFDGLRREHDPPRCHQSSDSRHFFTGVFIPLRIDSRMPGMERR